jgi:hypothetical protein
MGKRITVVRLVTGALLALGLALALAAPAGAVQIGIGDQKPDMFSDPRFKALDLKLVRRNVSWDVLLSRSQTAALDRWLSAARNQGIQPLLGFDHSWSPGRHKILPTARQFRTQFLRLHHRYPWVKDFATWNEANYCGQKICHHPDLVAAYYHVLRSSCPHCTVLAAELLDQPGMVAWVRQFDHYARVDPGYWGLHDYIGVNRFQTASTRQLLRATHGQIWLTEVAGLVARHNHSNVQFTQSAAHAADVTAFIFSKLVRLSPRISRVYLYEWDPVSALDSWDSALIGLNGQARPAYTVLARIRDAQLGIAPPNNPTIAASGNQVGASSSGPASGSRVATR